MLSDPYIFIDQLITAHRAQYGLEPCRAAIVNIDGQFTNEVDWITKELQARGIDTIAADARDFKFYGGDLLAHGSPINLTYNKLDQQRLVLEPGADSYLKAAAEGAVCFVNPLVVQCVLEDKGVLDLLTDTSLTGSEFTGSERDLIERHVPWTRVLNAGKTSLPDGSHADLATWAASEQDRLVLKPRNLTRGERVLIGPSTRETKWKDSLCLAMRDGDCVLQEYIPLPTTTDVPLLGEASNTTLNYGLAAYVFGGRFAGLQSRASRDPVVNIGHRGLIRPVFVTQCHDDDLDPRP